MGDGASSSVSLKQRMVQQLTSIAQARSASFFKQARSITIVVWIVVNATFVAVTIKLCSPIWFLTCLAYYTAFINSFRLLGSLLFLVDRCYMATPSKATSRSSSERASASEHGVIMEHSPTVTGRAGARLCICALYIPHTGLQLAPLLDR